MDCFVTVSQYVFYWLTVTEEVDKWYQAVEGNRFIILHAGGVDGWVDGCDPMDGNNLNACVCSLRINIVGLFMDQEGYM